MAMALAKMYLSRISIRQSFNLRFFSSHVIKENTFKTILNGHLSLDDPCLEKGLSKSQSLGLILQAALTASCSAGTEKANKKHLAQNKFLPLDRIKKIVDEDSEIFHLGSLAGLGMEYGDIPSAGLLTVVGKVKGNYCLVTANQATFKGGALYPIALKKYQRAQRLAKRNRLPCIYVVESGGAFLPLQADIFPDKEHGGRAFYNEAIMGSMGITQIAVVCGSCTAGGAYIPTMCDYSIMVEKNGTMYLAGPPLVKASTGEVVTDEDLGGATLHATQSGGIDYSVQNELEAFELCRDIILTLNLGNGWCDTQAIRDPIPDSVDLRSIAGLDVIDRNRVYQILARILDGSGFHEFKQLYGHNLITGFGFISGHLVGVISNCGDILNREAHKMTHFIQMCNMRNTPLIFLQNSTCNKTGFFHTNKDVLRDRSKCIHAHSTSTVPKITLNIGGCYGDDLYTMCGPDFNTDFALAWPAARFQENMSEEIPVIELTDLDSLVENTSSAFHWESKVLIDAIIHPENTRQVLSLCLDIVLSGVEKKLANEMRLSRLNQAVYRM